MPIGSAICGTAKPAPSAARRLESVNVRYLKINNMEQEEGGVILIIKNNKKKKKLFKKKKKKKNYFF